MTCGGYLHDMRMFFHLGDLTLGHWSLLEESSSLLDLGFTPHMWSIP
jgi:hypothetical protein